MTLDKVFKERLNKLIKNEPVPFTARTEVHFFNLLLILVINCDENARIVNEKMKKELQYLLGNEGEEKKEGFLDPISKSYVLKIKKAADD